MAEKGRARVAGGLRERSTPSSVKGAIRALKALRKTRFTAVFLVNLVREEIELRLIVIIVLARLKLSKVFLRKTNTTTATKNAERIT